MAVTFTSQWPPLPVPRLLFELWSWRGILALRAPSGRPRTSPVEPAGGVWSATVAFCLHCCADSLGISSQLVRFVFVYHVGFLVFTAMVEKTPLVYQLDC